LTSLRLRDESWNGVTVATVLLTGAHHRRGVGLGQSDLRTVGLRDLAEGDDYLQRPASGHPVRLVSSPDGALIRRTMIVRRIAYTIKAGFHPDDSTAAQ